MLHHKLVLILLVCASLVNAGCVGGDDAAQAADAGTTNASSESRAETLEALGAAEASAEAANATLVPVAWEGYLGTGAVACAVVVCAGAHPDGGDLLGDIAGAGPSLRFDLNLTWTPASPATEELWFAVFAFESCGDGCYEFVDYVEASGPSPLHLAGTIAPDDPGGVEGYGVYVEPRSLTPESYVIAGPEQRWTVEGAAWLAAALPAE
jgi:hypothetical protein